MATSQTIEFRDPGVRAAASAATAGELQDLHGDKLVLKAASGAATTLSVALGL